jgi:hypothetical protein
MHDARLTSQKAHHWWDLSQYIVWVWGLPMVTVHITCIPMHQDLGFYFSQIGSLVLVISCAKACFIRNAIRMTPQLRISSCVTMFMSSGLVNFVTSSDPLCDPNSFSWEQYSVSSTWLGSLVWCDSLTSPLSFGAWKAILSYKTDCLGHCYPLVAWWGDHGQI